MAETNEEKPPYTLHHMSAEQIERIENNFTYHPPSGDQPAKYEDIREWGKAMATQLCFACPPSRELSLALTKLEEAVFWANAAIARNETNVPNA